MLAIATTAHAQAPATPDKPGVTPLKVTVTISRYQGEKKISSLPYTLSVSFVPSVNSSSQNNYANHRIGTRVPVTTTTTPQGGGAPVPTVTYQDVGTSIDCFVFATDESGRFRLQISVDESSLYEDPAARGVVQVGRPTLRSFRSSDSLLLKDGQSAQVSNTPDRMTGESVRVDVALAVVK
jgi:hypothetical protein